MVSDWTKKSIGIQGTNPKPNAYALIQTCVQFTFMRLNLGQCPGDKLKDFQFSLLNL